MKKADEILSAFFRMYNLEDGAEYVSFFESWQEIVGVDLASHSRVADIQNGAAIVEMDHPGWMQMLQMKEQKILRAIQARFPDLGVERLSLRLVDQATWERRAGERKPSANADGPRPAADPATDPATDPAPPAADPEADAEADQAATSPQGDDAEVKGIPSSRLRESLSRLKEDLEERGHRQSARKPRDKNRDKP